MNFSGRKKGDAMKDLQKLFDECKEELASIGIVPLDIVSVTVNRRAKRRHGQTKARKNAEGRIGSFSINISSYLLDDDLPDFPAKNTIIHEILHCCEGAFNHGPAWKALADEVNRELGYEVKRCSNYEKYGIHETDAYTKQTRPKYLVYCPNCNAEWYYFRAGKVVKHAKLCRCGRCNTALSLKYL